MATQTWKKKEAEPEVESAVEPEAEPEVTVTGVTANSGIQGDFIGKDEVVALIPKVIHLMNEASQKIVYQPGLVTLPRSVATHWWMVANGVKIHGE